MTELTTLEFINGLFSLLVIVVGAIIGLIIALKYFKFKRKLYLYWGITYIGFYCAWWGSGISFISVLITGQPLSPVMYIAIGNLLIPLLIILWMLGFTEMIYQDKRKILVLIYLIVLTICEILVIYYLLTDYTQLGTKTGLFDIKYERIVVIYLMFINFSITIPGLLFARQSLKSDDREVRFKGKALIIAFLTYPICGFIDAGLELDAVGVIIIRSLLMFGAIMFYIGFFVPLFIKKIFNLE